MPKIILIVDDEPGILSLLKINFKSTGWITSTVASVDEAIELLRREHFDVVLSDVRTPGVQNGHDLARWLAKQTMRTPFVLMTGWDVECADCPLVDKCVILPKPFTLSQARVTVQQVLDKFEKEKK